MTVSTARRKDGFKTHRFVTTSVVSETSLPYNCNAVLDTPEKSLDFWSAVITKEPDYEDDKESLIVVLLNTRLRPYAWHRVSLGTLSEAVTHPREVLRPVIAGAAHGFVMMHNHPSGDPSPSRGDEMVTRRIVEASALMQVAILDHVIIGKPAPGRSAYYSFREAGIVP